MKTQYFCRYHAERMKASESEAYHCWNEMMRRGVHAYTECRMEAAHIYLGSALDIAILRRMCEKNGIFESLHATKPADFLLQLMLIELRFNETHYLLSRLSSTTGDDESSSNAALTKFLSAQYERVEVAEKSHITRDSIRDYGQSNRQSLKRIAHH
ncbi:MAG: hypothetical protein P8Y45_09540 [Exilibacterium sp.]